MPSLRCQKTIILRPSNLPRRENTNILTPTVNLRYNPIRRPVTRQTVSRPVIIASTSQSVTFRAGSLVNGQSPFINISSSDTTDHAPIEDSQNQIKSTSFNASTEDLSCRKYGSKLYSKCVLCHRTNEPSEYKYCGNCWKNMCSSRPMRKIKKKKRLNNKSKDQKPSEAATLIKRRQVVKSSTPSTSDSNDCLFCFTNKKNSAFIHGQYGHLCCCYTCGKKAWKQKRVCPICNRVINNVVKIYDV